MLTKPLADFPISRYGFLLERERGMPKMLMVKVHAEDHVSEDRHHVLGKDILE